MSTEKRDAMLKEVESLVDLICSHAEGPFSWPMTQKEQVTALQYIISAGLRLKVSNEYNMLVKAATIRIQERKLR